MRESLRLMFVCLCEVAVMKMNANKRRMGRGATIEVKRMQWRVESAIKAKRDHVALETVLMFELVLWCEESVPCLYFIELSI